MTNTETSPATPIKHELWLAAAAFAKGFLTGVIALAVWLLR